MHYFNAAGHGLPDQSVRRRMIDYLEREDAVGVPCAEAEAAQECRDVRVKTASLIGAAGEDIAMMPSTSAAANAVSVSMALDGRRVLMAPGSWSSDVAALQRRGARLECIPAGSDGLDLTGLGSLLDQDVAAIYVPMICSLTGERYPVEQIGALARPDTCCYVVDAAQAVGQIPVDVGAMNADVVVAPLRKWVRGPRGTAFLWMRPEMIATLADNPSPDFGTLIHQGGALIDKPDVTRFQPMGIAMQIAQMLGLGVALDRVLDGPELNFARIAKQRDRVRAIMTGAGWDQAVPEQRSSAIVTSIGPKQAIAATFDALTAAGIVAKSPGIDCEPLRSEAEGQIGYLRLSAHVYNTDADFDALEAVISRHNPS